MKTILTSTLLSLLALSPAFPGPKEDVKAAVEKLAGAANYTWVTKAEMAGGNFTPPTITGKAEKGGFVVIQQEREGNVSWAVLKGEKGVAKTDDGWKTAEEIRAAAQGGGGGGGFMRGMLLRVRPLAEEAGRIADRVKELKGADGVVSGDLTEEGAKELLSFRGGRPGGQGGGGGGQGPEVKGAKGSVKYWIKDGQLAKMEVKLAGSMTTRDGQEREVGRTTTYEIKDVGTTKVEAPDDAKKKLD